jgi:hypothetical protein
MYTTQGAGVPIASSPVGATATKSPTNGLQFSFVFPNPGANPATCFDWTFTGPGSPAAQADRFSGTVLFTGAGAGTIVCTVTGATPPPTNQVYTITVSATAGVPRDVEEGQEAAPAEPVNNAVEEYDPFDHTVAEVLQEATDGGDPEYTQGLIEAEQGGKNRVTLIRDLESLLAEQQG